MHADRQRGWRMPCRLEYELYIGKRLIQSSDISAADLRLLPSFIFLTPFFTQWICLGKGLQLRLLDPISIYNINTQYQVLDQDVGSTEWKRSLFFVSHVIALLSHLISPTTINNHVSHRSRNIRCDRTVVPMDPSHHFWKHSRPHQGAVKASNSRWNCLRSCWRTRPVVRRSLQRN